MSKAAATVFIAEADEPYAYLDDGGAVVIRLSKAMDANLVVLSSALTPDLQADWLGRLEFELRAVREALYLRTLEPTP